MTNPNTETQQVDVTAQRLGVAHSLPIFDRTKLVRTLPTPSTKTPEQRKETKEFYKANKEHFKAKAKPAIEKARATAAADLEESDWLQERKDLEQPVEVTFLNGDMFCGSLHKLRDTSFVCGKTLIFKHAVRCVRRADLTKASRPNTEGTLERRCPKCGHHPDWCKCQKTSLEPCSLQPLSR
jgi:hypothetical protein